MAKVYPVVIEPYDPALGMLVPLVTQRIINFSQAHVPEVSAQETARVFLSRAMVLDPTIRLVAFVQDGGKCVGHAVATIETLDGTTTVAHVWQVHIDQAVDSEEAVPQALDLLIQWAREYSEQVLVPRGKAPISKVKIETSRDAKGYIKKYGFERLRQVLIKTI